MLRGFCEKEKKKQEKRIKWINGKLIPVKAVTAH
jgi:hypothetical protein